jgi:ribosomal protein S5
MNSTISASITASRGGDFFKQFTNSAVSQGISTVAANTMKTSLEAAGMTENNVKALSNTTYNIVNAAAYAAVRGTSVEDALKVVGQKELARQVASKLKQAYQERKKVT